MQCSGLGWRVGRGASGVLGVLGVLVAVPCPGAQDGRAGREKGLVVEYNRTGVVPGSEERSTARQRLTVNEDGKRICFEDFPDGVQGKKYILQADAEPPVIYEILRDGTSYRRHSGDLVSVQKDRRVTELNEIQLARSLPENDRKEFFREYWWLRPDGKREARVERRPGVVVLGHPCENIVVTENGRTIIEGAVTKDAPPGAKNYYQFYRRLGAFSDEVLEQLEGLEGVLLSGNITVVTALRANAFELEATSFESVEVPSSTFDVSGLTEVLATPKSSPCPVCKKIVNTKRATRKLFSGKLIYLCSEKCADEHNRRVLKTGKK